jgi:hypothetical protein
VAFSIFCFSRAETGFQHSFKYPAHPILTGWGKLDGREAGWGKAFLAGAFDSWLKKHCTKVEGIYKRE